MPLEHISMRREVNKSIDILLSKRVLVGIPQSNDARADGPVGNAALGYIHHYGSPARNIPARPWLIPPIEKMRDVIADHFRKMGGLALAHKRAELETAQNDLGMLAVGKVQEYLTTSSNFAPLKESTIAARARKHRPPPYNPLIDSGSLRRSVTYVIRNKAIKPGKDR
jgi:hypothetical protein